MDENLYALLRSRFEAAARRPALVDADGRGPTFAELDGLVARFAAVLRSRGVEPGDRVVAQVDKSVAGVVLYLATLRAGAVFVPLNTAYTPAEVSAFLADAEPRFFVCRDAAAAPRPAAAAVEVLGAAAGGPLWDEVLSAVPDPRVEPRRGDDLAAIVYTSGTTGRSKGAMLSHRNLASNARTLVDLWGMQDADVLLHALPVYHVHGLFVALHTAMLAGATTLFLPRFDAAEVRALLPHATVMMGVPTFYTRLLALEGFGRDDCRAMRLFVSGSAPLLAETWQAFADRTGHRILERYGMTETGMITSNPLDGERLPGTVGFPLPDVRVRIVGDDGSEAPPGVPGVLEVWGPNVFRGYWRLPEKTAGDLRSDGFFVTGDIATADASGRVTLVGRAKDLIIRGGLNVYPREVEEVLDAVPGVVESAVVGVPDDDFGEAVVAVVVRAPGAPVGEADLLAAVRARLARFKHPRRIEFVDELPRNAMGKVQKNELRARLGPTAPAQPSSPETQIDGKTGKE